MRIWAALAAVAAGAQDCSTCHAELHARHLGSAHARALTPATGSDFARRIAGWPVAERSGIRFEYRPVEAGLEVVAAKADRRAAGLLEWVFGSGAQAYTPVGRMDGRYFEHRVSYYTRPSRPGLTLGHPSAASGSTAAALGILQTQDTIFRCFDCHATGVRRGPDLSRMRAGIQCERCHGSGQRHRVVNPGKLPAKAVVEFCGQCHRNPSPEHPLSDPMTVRFQPIGLMASACLQRSGRLSCLTCHDPHADARRDAAFYSATCIGCHSRPASGGCPRTPGNCVPCHMRQSEPAPNLRFTDHRIRVY